MHLQSQQILDQARGLATPLGKAALSVRRSATSGLGQAMDVSQDFQRQLEQQLRRLSGRPQRDSRTAIAAAGAVLVVAGIGAAFLTSATLRRAVGAQFGRIRDRFRNRQAVAALNGAAPEHEREDGMLDASLAASFPASDPVGANRVN